METLPALNFPRFAFEQRVEQGKTQIFDPIRARWVVLTPEEWVRQHMVQFLIQVKGYPAGLTGIEHTLRVGNASKRCDIVIFSRQRTPYVLVECKAPSKTLDRRVFAQAATYNITFAAPLLLITNGLAHYCARIDASSGELTFLEDIPTFQPS